MRKIFTFLFAALMSVSMFALTPLSGDEWDDATKTLTVNSNTADDAAYDHQDEIEHVIISSGVTSIGIRSFYYCKGLISVTIPEGVEIIPMQCFDGCSNLTSVTLPSTLTTIGYGAFTACKLTSVTLPDGLTTISGEAFLACPLTTITIPSSVTNIGYDAFYDCTNITDIYCYPDAADLDLFDDWDDDFKASKATVCHVHANQLEAYQTKFPTANVTFEGDLDAPADPINCLYMEISGTAGTLKWGDPGSNAPYGSNGEWLNSIQYLVSVTIDESCQNHTFSTLQDLFANFEFLTTINNIENLATANVTNMRAMFAGCEALTSLDLSSFNTAQVTNMESMFTHCSVLQTLNISSFNTAQVTNMGAMFALCPALTAIYVGENWSTAAVIISSHMFYNSSNLPNYDSSLDAEHQDASKAHTNPGGYLSNAPAPQPVVNLKLIEFQVPAEWEEDYTPISSADFPGFVATTYEIASALPVTSENPLVVVYDFPGNDESSIYSKMGEQVEHVTGTYLRGAFFNLSYNFRFYYPVLAGDEPTAVENVQTNQVQATKILRNGMLLIERNGKFYNMTGAEVK